MADLTVAAGVCGFTTRVTATTNAGRHGRPVHPVRLPLHPGARPGAARVDPLREITYRGEGPALQAAAAALPHPACIVPAGILKAVEVAAGLALPRDAEVRALAGDRGGEQVKVIGDREKDIVKQSSASLSTPIRLVMFTQETECQYCAETRGMVEQLAEISPLVTAEIHDFGADGDAVHPLWHHQDPGDRYHRRQGLRRPLLRHTPGL